MQTGIVVLIILGVMIFSQVVLLARAARQRHEETAGRLTAIERRLDENAPS